jgi:capsular polysaccharide biosynthesis protein
MELVAILRLLWRQRMLVIAAGLLAIVAGCAMAYRIGFPPNLQSRQYQVGIGSVTALVDTPSSQVVDLGGETGSNVGSLSARASLLANLMTSSPIKDEIATHAGVDPDKLIAVQPATTGGTGSASAGDAIGSTNSDDPRANILRASIPELVSGEVPIISVSTQAPDAATAARLANESIRVLQAQLQSVAGSDRVPEARRVVVRQLGPARFATVSRGPGKIFAVIVAFVVFLLGCAVIVGVSALVRGWRRLADMEDASEEASSGPAEVFEDDDRGGWRSRELPSAIRGEAPEESRPPRVDIVSF